MRNLICFVTASLFLTGCVINNYEKYYVDQAIVNKINTALATDHIGEPEISAGSSDKKADALRLYEDGYSMVGYSSFHAVSGATREGVVAQAKKVRAARVLTYQKYMATQKGLTRFEYGASLLEKDKRRNYRCFH